MDFTWGNDNWRAVLWGKVTIVNMILQLGFDLVLSDTDVVWFKDPLQVFKDFPTVRPACNHPLSALCRREKQTSHATQGLLPILHHLH